MLTASANRCIVPKVMRTITALSGGFALGLLYHAWRELIEQERLKKAAESTLTDEEFTRLRYYVGLVKHSDGH